MAKRTYSPEVVARWRAAAHRNKPWLRSTGPRTPEGKAKSAFNGKKRQHGPLSYRELFATAKVLRKAIREAAARRKEAEKALSKRPPKRKRGRPRKTAPPTPPP